MNDRIVEDVLSDEDGAEAGAVTYERVLRVAVFCALAFLAVFAGSAVATVAVPIVYPEMGFGAGHAAGTITAGFAGGFLWRYWRRVDAVLPDGNDAE